MLIKGTDKNNTLKGKNTNDTLKGNAGNDYLFGGNGDDLIDGGAGDDWLYGGGQNEAFFTTGGSDTLTGGKGLDAYYISLENGGGSVIRGESADAGVSIVADNTDVNAILDTTTTEEALKVFNDPKTWGDAAIELSRPEKGIVGLEKSGTNLIIDINRDGVAEASDDLTITNYFDSQGDLGKGAPALINNITDQQDIVDFFA
jgi:Ca2+-binding RTX toxin-like protein